MEKIAVRELAYFVYQSVNLTSSTSFNQKAIDGKYLHQVRQSEYDNDSIKEYYISKIIKYNEKEYEIHGYIDGVLENRKKISLEEIKTTDNNIYDPNFVEKSEHLAQLKIYGYLMLLDDKFKNIELNLLYIERKTLKRRNFKYHFNFDELENFFFDSLKEYLSYLEIFNNIEEDRIKTSKNIKFPFKTTRTGQDEMLKFLDENLIKSKFNFILAPTGIGKTIASLYSAIKKQTEYNDKIFYLTAKTSGKNIAINSLKLLIDNGFKAKIVTINAKRKICLKNTDTCDMDNCPFAKDFFNKLKIATKDILSHEDIIDDIKILQYAKKYELCSFEFNLHLSEYAAIIICDYNYIFDPKVKLIRFFEDNKYHNLILCDEAHNLVSRSQNMYSISLSIIDLLLLKKLLNKEENISKKINKLINYIHKNYDNLINNGYFLTKENDLEIENSLFNICQDIEEFLENELELLNKEQVIEKYLLLKDYLRISKLYGDAHIFLIKLTGDNLQMNLNCLDASSYLKDIIIKSTKGITYFSATLYPIEYYKQLLVCDAGIKYLCLNSPFPKENLAKFIAKVSTRYKDRIYTISYLINIIKKTINARPGKYIVFFPSYEYLKLCLEYLDVSNYDLIIQKEGLNEIEQKNILEKFNEDNNILGLFVLGGIFSEGVDFIGDKLHGVIVVGVGFPQINLENEILRNYFNNLSLNGFDYAYTYPGFNKVIQAVGRVIRTENDKGIMILIDDRYLSFKYLNIFPKHWSNYLIIKNESDLEDKLNDFWFNN